MTRTCCLQPAWNSTNSSCIVVFFRFLFCHQIVCVSVNFRNATSKFKRERSRVCEEREMRAERCAGPVTIFPGSPGLVRFCWSWLGNKILTNTSRVRVTVGAARLVCVCVWIGPFAVDFDGQFQRPPLFFLGCLFHFWFCWITGALPSSSAAADDTRACSIIQNQASRETEKKRKAIYPKNRHSKRQNKSNR